MTDNREPTIEEQIEALENVIELHGPCNHFDHHGNCQTHFVEDPCSVAALPVILASLRRLQALEQA